MTATTTEATTYTNEVDFILHAQPGDTCTIHADRHVSTMRMLHVHNPDDAKNDVLRLDAHRTDVMEARGIVYNNLTTYHDGNPYYRYRTVWTPAQVSGATKYQRPPHEGGGTYAVTSHMFDYRSQYVGGVGGVKRFSRKGIDEAHAQHLALLDQD